MTGSREVLLWKFLDSPRNQQALSDNTIQRGNVSRGSMSPTPRAERGGAKCHRVSFVTILTKISFPQNLSDRKKYFFSFKNFLLLYLLLFILIFDFSLHIPIIQLLFVLLISINFKKSENSEYSVKN